MYGLRVDVEVDADVDIDMVGKQNHRFIIIIIIFWSPGWGSKTIVAFLFVFCDTTRQKKPPYFEVPLCWQKFIVSTLTAPKL